MVDFYKVLGVGPEASRDEIQRAWRRETFRHHPDTNPEGGRASQQRFHEIQEAWNVLRDEGKRAQYDRMRAAGFGSADFEEAAAAGGGFSGGMPWGQPSVDSKEFDAAFDAWWKKMSEEFQDFEERQYAAERLNAERMAKAAAWEWEKQEAAANKVRSQRLKWRTEDARMQRHATTLRRFWQTHAGFTVGDALFVALFLAGAAGITLTWRSHIQEARQQQQQQQQQDRQQAQALPAVATATAAQSS